MAQPLENRVIMEYQARIPLPKRFMIYDLRFTNKDLPYTKTEKSLKSYFLNLKSSFGFTLIELLIVIAIIGVLATILLANFIGVRQRSRDAQRKADLRQIQSAIELYKADQGTYPLPPLYSASCLPSSPLKDPGGTVTYMKKIPCDPSLIKISLLPPGNYAYGLNGTTYDLYACIENSNDTDANISDDPSCPSNRIYKLTNP